MSISRNAKFPRIASAALLQTRLVVRYSLLAPSMREARLTVL